MIDGFEEETKELDPYELETLLPIFVGTLPKKLGPNKAVKSKDIISGLKSAGYIVNGARVRKIINYIRRKNLVPCLIASSKGYYIATETKDLQRFVDSLKQREDAIRAVRIAMHHQLEFKTNVEFKFP